MARILLVSLAALLVLALSAPVPAYAQAETPAPTPPAATVQSLNALFERGIELYERGEYAAAAVELEQVIAQQSRVVGFDPEKVKRAHLYRGISLFLLNDRAGADAAFWQVLRYFDPEFKPDPLFTPPAVIAAFEQLKRERREELAKVPRVPRRNPDPPRDPLGIPIRPQPEPGAGDFWASIAPFGWAQFKNEQPVKGYAFLTAEVVLLTVNLTTYATLESVQREGSRFENVQNARVLKTTNNATFFLLLGTLVYGSADGIWTATQKRTRSPAAPVLTPGPGNAGVQMTWRF